MQMTNFLYETRKSFYVRYKILLQNLQVSLMKLLSHDLCTRKNNRCFKLSLFHFITNGFYIILILYELFRKQC